MLNHSSSLIVLLLTELKATLHSWQHTQKKWLYEPVWFVILIQPQPSPPLFPRRNRKKAGIYWQKGLCAGDNTVGFVPRWDWTRAPNPPPQLKQPLCFRLRSRRPSICQPLQNLRCFDKSSALGSAALTDSNKLVLTESYTCCSVSSLHCLLSFSKWMRPNYKTQAICWLTLLNTQTNEGTRTSTHKQAVCISADPWTVSYLQQESSWVKFLHHALKRPFPHHQQSRSSSLKLWNTPERQDQNWWSLA